MTRPFNVHYSCAHCGRQTTAETAFGRWMRAQPVLDSARGIVRTDTDHTILRYKTNGQGRQFQLIMDLEVKEHAARPTPAQRDILLIKHQLICSHGINLHGAVTRITREVLSVRNGQRVKVRYLGSHLLVFEKTCPQDSAWIEWDHRLIAEQQLIGLLALDLDPNNPSRPMQELLRDRHMQRQLPLLRQAP